MYVIGLTGGIASGKSTAAQTLRTLGAQVIDADAISRTLTAPTGAAAPEILAHFGTTDRTELGRIIFSDPEARAQLNAIVHPMVQQQMEAEIAESTAPVVVLDIPLLYEAGLEDMCDEIWVVYVSRQFQVQRIMARDGLSQEDALARINSQMPTEEKLRRADVAIDTSGSFSQTRMQIESYWRTALSKVEAAPQPESIPSPRRRQHRYIVQHTPPAPQEAVPPGPRYASATEEEDDDIPVRFRATVRPQPPQYAWEDTSTLLEIPEQRTFFSRQPPLFWVAAGLLLVALLAVTGIIGVNTYKEYQAEQAEARRLQQLAEEKARYKFVYRDWVEQYALEQGVDPALAAAVIYNESRFDPQAVSYLGARGLMQIMEETGGWIAERLGEKDSYTFDAMFDPETNIRFGLWYLGYLARTFDGNIVKMAAGYHAGQNAVLGWLKDPQYSSDGVTLNKIPYPDTEQYVQRVVDTYAMYIKHYYTTDDTQAQSL